jgi:hypothetical protein
MRPAKQINSKITKKKEKDLISTLLVKKKKLTNLILEVLSTRSQVQKQSSISQIICKKILTQNQPSTSVMRNMRDEGRRIFTLLVESLITILTTAVIKRKLKKHLQMIKK